MKKKLLGVGLIVEAVFLLSSSAWAGVDVLVGGAARTLPNRLSLSASKTCTPNNNSSHFECGGFETAPVSMGELSDTPTWNLSQWGPYQGFNLPLNNQGNLSDGEWALVASDGIRAAQAVNVGVYGTTYRLILNSFGAPGLQETCDSDDLACVPCTDAEVNLNLGPHESVLSAAWSQGMIAAGLRPTLGTAAEYRVAWRQNTFESTHQEVICPAPYNLHTTLVGLIWHNFVTDPTGVLNHTIFYQIHSRDSRGWTVDKSFFMGTPTQSPWGVADDVLTAYGVAPDPADGLWHDFDINFKARLSDIIQNDVGHLPTDPNFRNPVNWTPTGLYISSAINGEGMGNVHFQAPRWYTAP
jgi:hypothetical protein